MYRSAITWRLCIARYVCISLRDNKRTDNHKEWKKKQTRTSHQLSNTCIVTGIKKNTTKTFAG